MARVFSTYQLPTTSLVSTIMKDEEQLEAGESHTFSSSSAAVPCDRLCLEGFEDIFMGGLTLEDTQPRTILHYFPPDIHSFPAGTFFLQAVRVFKGLVTTLTEGTGWEELFAGSELLPHWKRETKEAFLTSMATEVLGMKVGVVSEALDTGGKRLKGKKTLEWLVPRLAYLHSKLDTVYRFDLILWHLFHFRLLSWKDFKKYCASHLLCPKIKK